ncbi:bifunctional 3-hydroxydecanoyl-ACP dehydratase/trans-2-decenoyl-ACP isomerase [Myxococcota bacterium]|nr:bifunctional 3-hydroxydecanoyl-ACP dehydratase/trans-2-decenoyl-ACP isomerase [Myxococcota bacterium]
MKYREFLEQESFAKEEIIAFANGTLVEDAPDEFTARLPLPPMLMLDRVLSIEADGNRGRIVAERDVHLDDWFFQCHFRDDPVQPGCLGVDGVWQLIGFYCNWRGGLGSGRALGCGAVEFSGQIRPHDQIVRYEVSIRRYTELPNSGAAMAIGDAKLLVDDVEIYTVEKAKVGLFTGIGYHDYPNMSENASGGRMEP